MRLQNRVIHATLVVLLAGFSMFDSTVVRAQATDPGVRLAAADGGPALPLAGLTADETAFFQDGLLRFSTAKVVVSPTGDNSGLGPRYNSNSCSSCHQQPFVGGSSPAVNPLLAVAKAGGATNTVPWFIVPNGPVREARFVAANGVPDGGVHDLFVVAGRSDVASNCTISQPDFTPAGNGLTAQGGNRNIVYRIPTPVLGAGLIEAIPDSAILANVHADAAAKRRAGVWGHPNAHLGGNINRSANDLSLIHI